MNREIKFRAWDKEQQQMYTPVIDTEGKAALVWYGYEIQGETDDVVMQFTGLKDKNGVEIYEGDIVKLESRIETVGVAEVYFKDCSFFVGGDLQHPMIDLQNDWLITYEVIGNLYENPELLNNQYAKN